MKVGTDSVLLGCWTGGTRRFKQILDIGTGTGVLSLLLAERMPCAEITALEIDPQASAQAEKNITSSPWGERIRVIHQDFCTYSSDRLYDCILSNPPYFQDSLRCPDLARSQARHTISLSYRDLIEKSSVLLSEDGVFSLIVPVECAAQLRRIAFDCGLYTFRQATVHTKYNGTAKRIMMEFSRKLQLCRTEEITIHAPNGEYSVRFWELTKAFYPENHSVRS